jgi:hypothetical protein
MPSRNDRKLKHKKSLFIENANMHCSEFYTKPTRLRTKSERATISLQSLLDTDASAPETSADDDPDVLVAPTVVMPASLGELPATVVVADFGDARKAFVIDAAGVLSAHGSGQSSMVSPSSTPLSSMPSVPKSSKELSSSDGCSRLGVSAILAATNCR